MININNQSSTVIIVIHEIYGLNQHMQKFCKMLGTHGYDVICPNIIERDAFEYSEEEAAYLHFKENIGFAKVFHFVKDILLTNQNKYEKVIIIGFSVGATVAWLCSELPNVNGIVGFYGSRIREYVDINPQCPVLLFFPEEESSFSVDELISKLSEKPIEINKLKGQHGFSDPFSSKYQEESAQKAMKEMESFFNRVLKLR